MQWIIVAKCPYANNEIDGVYGPFISEAQALVAKDQIIKAGGHPDADWAALPIKSYFELLEKLKKENNDA